MSVIGKYRNGLGVELEITGIYNLRLFGNRIMLVTAEGLTDCGYVKVDVDDRKEEV